MTLYQPLGNAGSAAKVSIDLEWRVCIKEVPVYPAPFPAAEHTRP